MGDLLVTLYFVKYGAVAKLLIYNEGLVLFLLLLTDSQSVNSNNNSCFNGIVYHSVIHFNMFIIMQKFPFL
jgi:hypothetical protein